jgi:hypothetical protein
MAREAVPTDLPSDVLTISPHQVAFIATKAREFDGKDVATYLLDGSNPSDADDDGIREDAILEDAPGDLTAREYLDALRQLSLDEQLDLVALLWIGRGDAAPEEWESTRRSAAETEFGGGIPRYVATTPLAGSYLANGMNQLGFDMADYGAEDRL